MSIEASRSGEDRPFNFDAMSVEQIQFLGSVVLLGGDRAVQRRESDAPSNELQRAFVSEMGRFLENQPDPAKLVIKQAALSKDDYYNWTAVISAEPLAKVDYPLARAVILYVSHAGGVESMDSVYQVSGRLAEEMPAVAANLPEEIDAVARHGIDGIPARLLD